MKKAYGRMHGFVHLKGGYTCKPAGEMWTPMGYAGASEIQPLVRHAGRWDSGASEICRRK